MNKTIKTALLIAGVILLAYGIYTLVIPGTEDLDLVKTQDNTNSFITIGFGIVAVVLSLIKGKN